MNIPDIYKKLKFDRPVSIVDYRNGVHYQECGINYEDVQKYVERIGCRFLPYDPETLPEADNAESIKMAILAKACGCPVIVVCDDPGIDETIPKAIQEMRDLGNRSVFVTKNMFDTKYVEKCGGKNVHAEDDVIIFD